VLKDIPPWEETYDGIRRGEVGKTMVDLLVDRRATEFLLELAVDVEKHLTKVSPKHGRARRRARLNPNNHPDVLI
jgi:hypothetical protein